MKHNEVSQVVIGNIIEGRIDPNAVNPLKLFEGYGAVLEDIKEGMDRTDLMAKHGWEPVNSALEAANATKDSEGFEWVRHLEEVAARAEAGKKLARMARKLDGGEDIDVSTLLQIASNWQAGVTDFTTMANVEPESNPWVPSFYPPIDDHIGGYPQGGLTIIAGPAGLGKTTLLLDLLARAAKNGKRTAFFSLEMTLGMAAMRLLQITPDLTDEERELIIATGEIMPVEDVFTSCVRLKAEYPDLYFIGVDYADKMVQGSQSEEIMGRIYNTLSRLAVVIGVPIVLIAGVSRSYVGGEPMVNHIRYSGRAEHDASVIILIVNPDKLAVDMGADNEKGLPYVPSMGYLKVGKSRFGTREGGLGAVQIDWIDDEGRWGDESYGWYTLEVG